MSLRPANPSGEPSAPFAGPARHINVGSHPFWERIPSVGKDICGICGAGAGHSIHTWGTANVDAGEEIEHAGGTK